MIEDFSEAPVAYEDKQKKLIEIHPIKIAEIECLNCKSIFKFGETIVYKNEIKEHMKEKKHYSIRIKRKNHNIFESVKCKLCPEKNIKKLFVIFTNSKNTKLENLIYCEKHFPQGFDIESLMNVLQLEDIMNRKFNKVQLKYKYKDIYYKIHKPLVIAEMEYTRKLYESKEEFEFELFEKNERYYFLIPDDFTKLNISQGRVLHFKQKENIYLNEEDEDYEEIDEFELFEEFTFLAVITKIEIDEKDINKENTNLKIWINPINRHISSLKGHTGMYIIKEGFCLIPYQRFLEALDSFVNDMPEDDEIYDRAVSSYITERIMGNLPFNIPCDNKEMNEKVEEILRIEKNTVDLILFKEKENFQLVKEIFNFGSLNESQINALESIFKNPFNLIQGPPGTGKTFLSSFIVYNIFNVRKRFEDKILLCAASNSAADNLASYLLRINKVTGNKMKILRVFSKTREYIEIKDEIARISLHEKLKKAFQVDDLYYIDKTEIDEKIENFIFEHDIIITTCSVSWDDRIKKNNFSFVIIDEATQCCELEALIPIVHGCKHLTLIGDQKQLGPVILHPQGKELGINISLFERMIKLYPELLNVLTIQYRMHPEIVKYPSFQFYENKIKNGEKLINEDQLKNEFIKELHFPNEEIPLLFLHIEAEENSSENNSKYNNNEAKIVVLYVEKLIQLGVNMNDIGIITPYRAQMDKIKKLLIKKNITNREELKIASVDGFQGREKKFIILSNVRSNPENNIGFLKDFRRLNVSITRAISGMIIIGNAKCLYQKETIWRNFINYYQKNNLICSPKVNKITDDEKEYNIEELEEITIGNEEDINLNENDFIFGKEEDYLDINQDLIDNFECTSNVYLESNKNYLKKINKKKNKKKKKYK